MYAGNRYEAEVVRWLDGDTVELVVDLGQTVQVRGHYRLHRIDAPETALREGVTEDEKRQGLELKAELTARFPPGTIFPISTEKAGKFGRYLVEIYLEDGSSLSDELLRDGKAKPYLD
jgi:micrococcal nuclease